MKLNLKNKLSLAIISVIVFFGILAVLFVFFKTESELISVSRQGLESVSRVQAHGLSVIFQEGKNLVKNIANDETIIEYMRIKNTNSVIEKPIMFDYLGGQVEISDGATLRRLVRYNIGDNYSAIYLINTNGVTWVSTDETFVGQNYAFRDYYSKAISGEPWVDVSIGVTSKKIGYYFSYPIKSSSGDIIGVVVVKMKPDIINQFITSNNINSDESIMFTDSNGVIIFSNDESRIYKSLGKLSQEQLNLINEKKRFSDIIIRPLDYDEVQEALNFVIAPIDYKDFIINDEIDNKREIVSVSKIKELPFYLVIDKSIEQFYGSSVAIASFLSLFVFVSAMFSIVIIIFLVNKLLNPLKTLQTGSEQLAKENFDYKFTIKTGDELEVLGESFNKMSKKLEVSYNKLKDQVGRLRKVNNLMVEREKKMVELKKQIKKKHENSNAS